MLGLDLSAGSTLVASNPADNAAEPFRRRVFDAMREAGAAIGAGGYDEARLIYATDAYATGAGHRRAAHGAHRSRSDAAGRHADLSRRSTASSMASRTPPRGSTTARSSCCGTRFPATSRDVLHALRTSRPRVARRAVASAQPIRAGERVRAHRRAAGERRLVAAPALPDHHGHARRRRATSTASRRRASARTWLSISPDPESDSRDSAGAIRAPSVDARICSPATTSAPRRATSACRTARSPCRSSAAGCSTSSTRPAGRYIDAYNNVPHVGHAHPRVTAAPSPRSSRRSTRTRATCTRSPLEYAARARRARCPRRSSVCFFTTSGSEANELALRLARAHTRQRDLVVMDAAYHGHTTTLIDISPYKHDGPGGEGRAGLGAHVADSRRLSRRVSRPTIRRPASKYARDVGAVIDRIRERGRGLLRVHRRDVSERRRPDHLAAGFLADVYRLRARGRRRLHRRRGADRLRPHRHALLGVRGPRRRPRHRRARQADRERLSDGRGGHDARRSRRASTTGWSSSARSAAARRRARRVSRRCARRSTTDCRRTRSRVGAPSAQRAARAADAPRSHRRRARLWAVRRRRARHAIATTRAPATRGSRRGRQSHARARRARPAPTGRITTSSRFADRCR